MSHNAEKFRRGGILYYCNSLGYRKGLGKRGGYQDFPSKIFCLTVLKSFVGEPFSVSLNSGTEKVWIREGWREHQDFPAKVFSHGAENFRRGNVYSCNNFGYRKSLDKRRGEEYQDFPSKLFCLTVPEFSIGESFTVAIISSTENVWIREGWRVYQVFPSKIFRHTVPKIFLGESFTVAIISGI